MCGNFTYTVECVPRNVISFLNDFLIFRQNQNHITAEKQLLCEINGERKHISFSME